MTDVIDDSIVNVASFFVKRSKKIIYGYTLLNFILVWLAAYVAEEYGVLYSYVSVVAIFSAFCYGSAYFYKFDVRDYLLSIGDDTGNKPSRLFPVATASVAATFIVGIVWASKHIVDMYVTIS